MLCPICNFSLEKRIWSNEENGYICGKCCNPIPKQEKRKLQIKVIVPPSADEDTEYKCASCLSKRIKEVYVYEEGIYTCLKNLAGKWSQGSDIDHLKDKALLEVICADCGRKLTPEDELKIY